jgi:hypothetical protein
VPGGVAAPLEYSRDSLPQLHLVSGQPGQEMRFLGSQEEKGQTDTQGLGIDHHLPPSEVIGD